MDNPFLEIITKLDEILLKLASNSGNVAIKKKESKPITTKDLCSFLGVSEPTIIRYRKKGKIPFYTIGSAIRYDKDKVIEALESIKSTKKSGYDIYKKEGVESLADPYVISKLKRQGFDAELIKNETELLELKRNQLKLKREIKNNKQKI